MRKTFRVYLRSGATIDIKGDEFKLTWNDDATAYVGCEVSNVSKWVHILPSEIAAVERIYNR